jgi:glycogen operon protein
MKRNFLATLLLSQGLPMLLAGDELGRSQRGNNNAYCQDNETTWFDWGLLERHADVHRFVRLIIAARLMRDTSWKVADLSLNKLLCQARMEWHGIRVGKPDWGDNSHSIALTFRSMTGHLVFHLMVNAWREPLEFQLPPIRKLPGGGWRRWIDTSLETPADIVPMKEATEIENRTYELPPRTLAVMFARTETGVKRGSR